MIIAIWIKLDSKGPIIFKQERFGVDSSTFMIFKFRTMRIDAPSDSPTHLLGNTDNWITKSGRILRKTSLDELPQLVNILFGQMSIIGPRPALWNQYDLMAEREKYNANSIKPGLTGLAQLKGRDTLEIYEKAKLDGQYVGEMSFKIDLKYFAYTIISVLKSDGIKEGSQSEHIN